MKKNIHSFGNDPGGGGSTHSASHPGRSWAPPCRGCRTACSAESAYVKVRTSSSRLHLEPTSNLCTINILFSRTCNREASALPPQNQPPNTGHLAACGFFTSSGKDIFLRSESAEGVPRGLAKTGHIYVSKLPHFQSQSSGVDPFFYSTATPLENRTMLVSLAHTTMLA